MGASKAADCVIIQDVGVCDICGAPGFEECLAVCTQCSERAEHVYCMQTLCDAVPFNWVCEVCKKSTVLESGEVQSERGLCASLLTDKFKENENKKATFSQKKLSAKTSQRHQKHDNNRQGSEEFETGTTIEVEHISDGVSKKLSCLILSAEDGLPEYTSNESSFKCHAHCSSPATLHHQSDLERVCHSLKLDGLKTASNPQLNDSSAVDAPQYFTAPPDTSGALEHPPPMSSNPLSPKSSSPSLSRSTEHVLPLKLWNSLQDNAEVIDMEIDVDFGNENGVAREPIELPSLSSPNQPDFPWTLLESPPFIDLELPPLPPGSPPVQASPPAVPIELGTQEESSLPPLPPDSPCMQPSFPQTPLDIVDCTDSPLPPLPPGSPPAQPSPPSTPGDQINGSPGSPYASPSCPLIPSQCHQDQAPESNLDFSAISEDFSAFAKHKSPGQEGDCSMSANLDSRLDKKRLRTASHAENIITPMSRKAPRYGLQSEILLGAAEPSRAKLQALSKKRGLESERRSYDSADGHKPLCPTASSDQQVKDDKKNATLVGQLLKDSLKSPEEKLLDNALSVASKIRSESGLNSNEEPQKSDISTRSGSDLACPSIFEQAVRKQGKKDTILVPWVPLEDGQVAQPSSINCDAASSCPNLNGVCDKQDITAYIISSCMDKNLISKVGGGCNVDDVRTCENARDNTCMQQVSCLPLFPALESSSVFDRTGILVDILSEHELLSDLSWQVMPLVQQLEEPWYKPPLPNLNDPPFPSSLDRSLIATPDEDFALTLRRPQYRKHGNIWITIESDTRTCYDENVKLSLSCCRL